MKTSYSSPPSQRSSSRSALFLLLLAAVVVTPMAGGIVKAGGGGDVTLEVISAWGGPVNDVDVAGDLAYAAIGRRLMILDIADPTDPAEIGSLYLESGVEGVRVSGDYVFLSAGGPHRFTVVDVADPANPTLVWEGQGNNLSEDVYLHGNLAYTLGNSGEVDVFDISDPPNTVHLGEPFFAFPEVMTIAGDRLYIGTDIVGAGGGDTSELRIYDLSRDPVNPPLLGSVASDDGKRATGLAVEGDYAAWAVKNEDNTDTLHIVDVSSAAVPTVLWSDGVNGHKLTDVDLVGGYAYVADAFDEPTFWSTTRGLVVYDVGTDPANPTIVSTFKTHGDVWGLRVIGDRAYLFDQGEGLIILDVSDPANPVRLGNFHSPSTLREMTKVGDLLYITDAWNGFTVLDVSNASHPEVVSVYLADHYNDLGVNAWGITVQDDIAYLGAGHLGLEVVDVSDPATPTFLGAFRVPSPADTGSTFAGVAVSGDIAHLGFNEKPFCLNSGIDWFLNLDVSDPQGIVELGRVQVGCGDPPLTIELNDQSIAFIGRESDQMIVDTSVAATPILILDGSEIGDAIDVALAGNLLYVASEDGSGNFAPTDGLWVQDVTDPANPVVLAHVDENTQLAGDVVLAQAYAVATQNQRLYALGGGSVPSGSFFVFDVSDPSTPDLLAVVERVGGWSLGSSATTVLVDEPYQYVANASPNAGNSRGESGFAILELLGISSATSADSFSAFRGFHDSGTLDDVLASDDSDLCYNPGIVLNPTEAPITLDFFGTLPNDSPASLDVTIESSANTVGLELTISNWNFNSNSWDVVGTDTQSLNVDTVRTFAGNPADHVEPGTGEVRTRYEVRQEGIIFVFPWLDCVDHVFWTTVG